jgi:hypothetical protein
MDCDYTQLEILILAISFEFGHQWFHMWSEDNIYVKS